MSLVDQANLIFAVVLFVAGKHIACKVSTPPFSSVCYAVHPHPPCCVPTMNLLGMVHSYSRMLAPCALLVSSPAPGSSTSLSTLPVNLLVSHHSTWTLELLTQGASSWHCETSRNFVDSSTGTCDGDGGHGTHCAIRGGCEEL